MVECPRCKIKQKQTDICKYCDFDMRSQQSATSEFMVSRKALGMILLALFLIIAFSVHSFRKPEDRKRQATSLSPFTDQTGLPEIIPGMNNLMKEMGQSSGGGLFSIAGIMISLIFSVIGLGFFRYGKKKNRTGVLFTGILLMAYTYFIDDPLLMTVVGIELCFLPTLLNMILE